MLDKLQMQTGLSCLLETNVTLHKAVLLTHKENNLVKELGLIFMDAGTKTAYNVRKVNSFCYITKVAYFTLFNGGGNVQEHQNHLNCHLRDDYCISAEKSSDSIYKAVAQMDFWCW